MTRHPGAGLVSRVPVFKNSTQGPKNETSEKHLEVLPSRERQLELAEALQVLFEFGYKVGCDGELLPPRWVRRARG